MSFLAGLDEGDLTLLLVLVTLLLAVGTFWMARASHKLATIAELQFRAERLPTLSIQWLHPHRDDRGLFAAVYLRNVSRVPVFLHEIRITAYAQPTGGRVHNVISVDKTLVVDEDYTVHTPHVGVTDTDVERAGRSAIPLAVVEVAAVVSAVGIEGTKETWRFIGLVCCVDERFYIDSRDFGIAPPRTGAYRRFRAWLERIKVEMGPLP